jgi:hypothetical protein
MLAAGAYFVATANEKWLRQHYHVPEHATVCQVSAMPSFPDDEGTVVFLNKEDSIIDELHYADKWHFPLITNPSGISLERINYALPGQDRNNWASASSASGYGTPGFQNSQYVDGLPHAEQVVVGPPVFSPDNDGVNDVAMIGVNMEGQGFIANAVVYDLSGRKVRYLLKNESVGMSAQFKWDGLDDKDQPLPEGIYILVTQVYNLKGKTKKFKNAIVLTRR